RQKIDDMWAFEVGVCKNCNEMYILGKVYNNKLYRAELDLDENYEFFDEMDPLDFYLIKEEVDPSYDDDKNQFEEYTVCSKCGMIHKNNQQGVEVCSCGDEYQVELLRVLKDEKGL